MTDTDLQKAIDHYRKTVDAAAIAQREYEAAEARLPKLKATKETTAEDVERALVALGRAVYDPSKNADHE